MEETRWTSMNCDYHVFPSFSVKQCTNQNFTIWWIGNILHDIFYRSNMHQIVTAENILLNDTLLWIF